MTTQGSDRLRVAFVSFAYGELAITLASGLADKADVLFVSDEEQIAPFLHLRNSRLKIHAPAAPRLRQLLGQLRFQLGVVKAIKAFDPDVIHLQHGHMWFNFALRLLRRYPLVISIHDPEPHDGDKVSTVTPQAVFDYGFRQADRLVVHVPQMVDPLAAKSGIQRELIDVVPLAETLDQGLAPDTKEKPNSILCFGRIWPYKGVDILIEAQPLVTAKIPDATFVIAGRGEDFARYRRMMIDPDRFVVHNEYIVAELQAKLFRETCLVVLPYLEATQSGVIVDAYSYHKPVVASDVGGIPAQVEHGLTGLLVEPGNAAALAEALIDLLSDDERRVAMGTAGHQKLTEEWSVEIVSDQTLDVYQRALRQSDRSQHERTVHSSQRPG